jgi:hypothetical protein
MIGMNCRMADSVCSHTEVFQLAVVNVYISFAVHWSYTQKLSLVERFCVILEDCVKSLCICCLQFFTNHISMFSSISDTENNETLDKAKHVMIWKM